MITYEDWGTIPYRAAWARQEEYRAARLAGSRGDTIIFCEHPRVFTTGRRDCTDDWRAEEALIRGAGIDIVAANRGGKITYHGPGQLVGYFIVNIDARSMSVRDFVHSIENILISSLAHWDIHGERDAENPGVWIGRNKIAALGLHVSQGITQHGFALNYAVALEDYAYILPCGIQDRGITSLHCLQPDAPKRSEVLEVLQNACQQELK